MAPVATQFSGGIRLPPNYFILISMRIYVLACGGSTGTNRKTTKQNLKFAALGSKKGAPKMFGLKKAEAGFAHKIEAFGCFSGV